VYPTAIINVAHGIVGTTYNVIINGGVKATYTTSDTAGTTTRTSIIATNLRNQMVTSLGVLWRTEIISSTILVWREDAADFTFSVNDSWGDKALIGIKEDARKIEDVPNIIPTFTADAHVAITIIESPRAPKFGQDYGTYYSVIIDGITVTVVHFYGTTKEDVAASLGAAIASAFSGAIGITVQVSGVVIAVWDTTGSSALITTANIMYNETTLAVEYIPAMDSGQNTIVVHVAASAHDVANPSGYYIKWTTTETGGNLSLNTAGVWQETRRRGLDNTLKASSMPHQMVRNSDGTFTFGPISWAERLVGDEDSAPNPSCVGKAISDVFLFKNRVGFLSGGNVILSKADDYWNFYPTSALEITDDDPIDITVPSTGVDYLRWGLPYLSDLLIFGPTDEYLLTSGDTIFSAKSATLTANTNFPVSPNAQPKRCGANIYFVSPKGKYAALHEYFMQPQTLTNDAADVTAHCPRYLPSTIRYTATSSTFNLFMGCSGDDTDIYVYKYYWAGDQKAQSAWFKWSLPYTVKALTINDNYVYILGCTGVQYVIEKIYLDTPDTGVLSFKIRLDQQTSFATVNIYESGSSVWQMPYEILQADIAKFHVVNAATGAEITGLQWVNATQVTVTGNYTGVPVFIGREYPQEFTFSTFGVQAPKSTIYSPQATIKIRTLIVTATTDSVFSLVVTPRGRAVKTQPYISSGRFMIYTDAKDVTLKLTNSSFHPATWITASWEGFYTSRNQGI